METTKEINGAMYGIVGKANTNKLTKRYGNYSNQFHDDMKSDPYAVMMRLLGMGFSYADQIIMGKHIVPADARCRCSWAAYDVLKSNESMGNTRMTDKRLAVNVNNLCHEAVGHIVDVVCNDARIYCDKARHWVGLRGTYDAEMNIADNIKSRLENPEPLNIDVEKYYERSAFPMTDEQKAAMRMVVEHKICMLNGPAGSSKSYMTKSIVDMLEDNGKSVVLLAPTGISSKVLRRYTGRNAMTIHMFLTDAWSPDYMLIDEAGMVSVLLLSALFNAVSPSTRFIFIADNAQLASIQCGNIVQDMIDSTVVPHVTLSRIFRYNTSGIVTIATDMRNGKSANLLGEFDDYRFIQTNADPIAQTITVYDELRENGYSEGDIVILSPFNKHVGADAINAVISNKYNPGKPVRANSIFKIGDKVINTKNKYEADGLIANGDIGHLVNVWYDRKHKINHVDAQFEDGIHNVGSLARLKWAWAISIHKAQGSSARVVILLLDKSHEFFLSRNLMYVGVTRARERLIIIGDVSAIEHGLTIIQNEIRNTWLKEFLVDNDTTI